VYVSLKGRPGYGLHSSGGKSAGVANGFPPTESQTLRFATFHTCGAAIPCMLSTRAAQAPHGVVDLLRRAHPGIGLLIGS
jgi:hypothetical protein